MHPITKKQQEAFDRGKRLVDFYKLISPEHQELTMNQSTVVGDMIADLYYTMTRAFSYPAGDIDSVKTVALDSLQFDHTLDTAN